MKKEACTKCGAEASVVIGNHRFDEMGVPVMLGKVELIKCSACGTVEPIIPNVNDLMKTLALAVICRPRKLNGPEIRFLRKYAGKSAREFSELLHYDHTSLSKLENGHEPIGDQTDKLVRFVVLNLSRELQYEINKLMQALPTIDDSCNNGMQIQIDSHTLEYEYV